jgi:maleate isomerase
MNRIGMIIPSSNTVVEPITTKLLSEYSDISVHFARFGVTTIEVSDEARRRFSEDALLEAAKLLNDADMDVIAYNATSGGWLGMEWDTRLCDRIGGLTGKPATTALLSLLEAMDYCRIGSFCYVSPSTESIVQSAIAQFERKGYSCTGSRGFGITMNRESSNIKADDILAAVEDIWVPNTDAIVLSGTNMRGSACAARLEEHYEVPVLDTVDTVLWQCMRLLGLSHNRVGFGASWMNEAKNFANKQMEGITYE